ncbi:putative NADH:ubiquinone oxidoreductase, subunit RnfA [Thioflavicoccus mobilis 8321]|uniref:Putative NADH:ubiquinone oxidoreductase, subunit RnfA n=1 Tax=Thioflavicoccus mobilis 8321 TaxID=765912 RepID=L0GTG6_9GAMM|nr:Rnf-Nqr domain containing protein [Thioflavicoccus mobilis]AGA89102.1 putative NADH:ubiquinone oxidoreductase, subunit RnfA [Thioflavicoccus mobilis 8321]
MAEASVRSEHELLVQGDLPNDPGAVRLVRTKDADIPIPVTDISAGPKPGTHILMTEQTLNPSDHYLLTATGVDTSWTIAPSSIAVLFSVILSASLISNFVFTKYLGLCVFFGVSRNRETAIGMGITFTIVGLLSGTLSWLLNHIALVPLKLDFLQIIAFIGIVACLVQASDLILKKLTPALHRKFGIYLMLITTNCIILAIPLLNATADASFIEAVGLSLGAGLGFLLALFLLSCARERVDLAPVPRVFRGLPIAFIITGLFALSFLGFSGLKVM